MLRKSRVKIDNKNVDSYIILQLFSDLNNTKLGDIAVKQIKEYIKEKNISRDQLLSLAMNFPARTMKKLIGSGVLYETM